MTANQPRDTVKFIMQFILDTLAPHGSIRTSTLDDCLSGAGFGAYDVMCAKGQLFDLGKIEQYIAYKERFTRLVDYTQQVVYSFQNPDNLPRGVPK